MVYKLHAIGPLCENVTSATKPEVHNVSQRREVWPGSFRAMRTDRQTNAYRYSSQFFVGLISCGLMNFVGKEGRRN